MKTKQATIKMIEEATGLSRLLLLNLETYPYCSHNYTDVIKKEPSFKNGVAIWYKKTRNGYRVFTFKDWDLTSTQEEALEIIKEKYND